MNPSVDAGWSWKRLAMGTLVVFVLCILFGGLAFGRNGVDGASRDMLLAPWFLVLALADSLRLNAEIPALPIVSGLCTLVVLAVAARRRWAMIMIVLWFAINLLGAAVFVLGYGSHS